MGKLLIYNISSVYTFQSRNAVYGMDMNRLKTISNVEIYAEDGIIMGIGTRENLNDRFSVDRMQDLEKIDAKGHAVIPGFVDSHTHFIFGGYRPEEFVNRLKGFSYMEIMQSKGGIRNTVLATRQASFQELYELGKKRLEEMLIQGVTTVEGKSGYGLDLQCEIKQLQVMEKLNQTESIDIIMTYLGAHAVADEFAGDADGYIDYIISQILPQIKKNTKAEFCDVFCEDKVFDVEQSGRLLKAAKKMGFSIKIHADEIVSLGGAKLAADLKAASADHLLMTSEKDIEALAHSNTVAALLPCTAFCLNKPYARARKMIDSGCAVALASDFNPGSCFTDSIPLIIALGVIQMKMSMEEVLCALTINGAAAVGKAAEIGSIEEGKKADINILKYDDYKFLIYNTAMNIVDTVIKNGKVVCMEGRIYGIGNESSKEP